MNLGQWRHAYVFTEPSLNKQQSCSYNSQSWCMQCICINLFLLLSVIQGVTRSLAVWSIYTHRGVHFWPRVTGHGAIPETWALCAQCRVAWQICWSILSNLLEKVSWEFSLQCPYKTHWFSTWDGSWWLFKLELPTDVAPLSDAKYTFWSWSIQIYTKYIDGSEHPYNLELFGTWSWHIRYFSTVWMHKSQIIPCLQFETMSWNNLIWTDLVPASWVRSRSCWLAVSTIHESKELIFVMIWGDIGEIVNQYDFVMRASKLHWYLTPQEAAFVELCLASPYSIAAGSAALRFMARIGPEILRVEETP